MWKLFSILGISILGLIGSLFIFDVIGSSEVQSLSSKFGLLIALAAVATALIFAVARLGSKKNEKDINQQPGPRF